MIILDKSKEGFIVGRNDEFPIAVFMINSWDGTLNTVLVSKDATDAETEVLRKMAYYYAELIQKIESRRNIQYQVLTLFEEAFDLYQLIPEREVKDKAFSSKHGKFIKNAYDSAEEVVAEIVKRVKETSGKTISISLSDEGRIVERSVYTVSLEDAEATEFTFWNYDPWPKKKDEGYDLHIVPGYHPSSPWQGRRTCGLLINGATDSLIQAKTICSVYSPEEARTKEKSFGTTWGNMIHPCKATGKSFQLTLSGFYHCTQELVEEVVNLVLCTLGAHPEGNYVGISGGFYPTYDSPGNIASTTGRIIPRTPYGSESHCMWTYDVLKKENQLGKAYIPKWFTEENWIAFFEGQEGIFPQFF